MRIASPPQRRIAAHTYAYRDHPLDAAVERIAELGFSAVEVWAGHASGGAAHVAKVLAATGMQAVAVSAGGFYDETHLPPRERSSWRTLSVRRSSSRACLGAPCRGSRGHCRRV